MQDYNNSVSLEFGKGGEEELNTVAEQQVFVEKPFVQQSPPSNEVSTNSFTSKKKHKEKKKQTINLNSIISSFVTVVAVATLGVTSGIVDPTPPVQVEILEWGSDHECIFYHVDVIGDAPVEVILYNDFTNRSAPLEEGGNGGEFDGLKPSVKYILAVVQEGAFGTKTTLAQKTIYTQKIPITEFYGVAHQCTCENDGYFHFTMNFVDENYYYYDFVATLTDSNGNVAYCEFNYDLQGDQVIDVVNNNLTGGTATFVITCNSYESGEPVEIELYRSEVEI